MSVNRIKIQQHANKHQVRYVRNHREQHARNVETTEIWVILFRVAAIGLFEIFYTGTRRFSREPHHRAVLGHREKKTDGSSMAVDCQLVKFDVR